MEKKLAPVFLIEQIYFTQYFLSMSENRIVDDACKPYKSVVNEYDKALLE